MRADFVNAVGRLLDIRRRDLIEKDLILHQVLLDLSRDDFFAPNFLFKGGTCLIKAYFGYLRFSEDIDFTWKDQRAFSGRSQNWIRRYLSGVIDMTMSVFEHIATKRGLDFRSEKSNADYIEFGGGNKTCTFKVWYDSEVLKRRSFFKVQINFFEKLSFLPKMGSLKGLLQRRHAELDALFPEYREYRRRISFGVYDIKEILCEKVRALLTREGTKARDFVDVYLICRRFDLKLDAMRPTIIDKTNFALGMYAKYRSNLKEKIGPLDSGTLFEWGQERDFLLSELDEEDFYRFLDGFQEFLVELVRELHQGN